MARLSVDRESSPGAAVVAGSNGGMGSSTGVGVVVVVVVTTAVVTARSGREIVVSAAARASVVAALTTGVAAEVEGGAVACTFVVTLTVVETAGAVVTGAAVTAHVVGVMTLGLAAAPGGAGAVCLRPLVGSEGPGAAGAARSPAWGRTAGEVARGGFSAHSGLECSGNKLMTGTFSGTGLRCSRETNGLRVLPCGEGVKLLVEPEQLLLSESCSCLSNLDLDLVADAASVRGDCLALRGRLGLRGEGLVFFCCFRGVSREAGLGFFCLRGLRFAFLGGDGVSNGATMGDNLRRCLFPPSPCVFSSLSSFTGVARPAASASLLAIAISLASRVLNSSLGTIKSELM